VVRGPKFINLFLSNVTWTAVDNAVFRLSTALSFSEIFALKIYICPKSRRTVFDYLRARERGKEGKGRVVKKSREREKDRRKGEEREKRGTGEKGEETR